jgi:uncharacterized protein (TIGR00299 family) protein
MTQTRHPTLAYFDCFSGISGDMVLGALVDAGGELAVVQAAVDALGLGPEVRLQSRHEQRGHLGGTRVLVEIGSGPSRRVPELESLVAEADIPGPVRERSLSALRRLGEAESALHSRPVEDVHLHELGGADTLVDLVGTFWLLHSLGVAAVHASPLPAPRGWLNDGLPIPAPASLRLLAGTGAVLEPDSRGVELVTPTGAVILATVATFQRPAMSVERVGYGIGGRDLPGNGLAVWLGLPVPEAATVTMIETNLDDMAPNLIAALVEDLMAAGALDVTVTSVLMKKGRPGHALAVMAETARATDLSRLLLASSTTLGLRMTRAERMVAPRQELAVNTGFGKVRVKVKLLEGRPAGVTAEFEDCRRLAREQGVDTGRVMRAAEAAARHSLGLE